MAQKLNYPWQEVIDNAKEKIAEGARVYQKWSCEHCGARQGMEVPNVFYTHGKCEECGKITDIKANGHNFLLYIGRH